MKKRAFACVLAAIQLLTALPVAAHAAHTHEYEAEIYLPTCTREGYILYVCSCGDSYVGETYPALGHNWNDGTVTREATCVSAGERTFACSRCSAKRTEAIPATGAHTYQNGVCIVCGAKDPCPSSVFTDVCRHDDTDAPDYAFHAAIDWAVTRGITKGTSATTFSPNEGCTRSQAVTFLWRAAGRPDHGDGSMTFTDVGQDAFYYDAVLWAVEQGITFGTSDSTFSPDETCTRAQIVTFLYRFLKGAPADDVTFTDVPADAWFFNAVSWAASNGITFGVGGGRFAPHDTCTRAQVVTFLYRTAMQYTSE